MSKRTKPTTPTIPRVLHRTYDQRSTTIDLRYIEVAMPRLSFLEGQVAA